MQCGPDSDGSPGRRFVLRLPPLMSTFPDDRFALQVSVQEAVGAAGIPVAGPTTYEADPSWLGVPFVLMPFVEGTIPGPASLFDPWLLEATEEQRRDSQREMVRVLASLKAVDIGVPALEELLGGGSGTLEEHLEWWRRYLDWAAGDQRLKRIEALFDWCGEHVPDTEAPPSLVWGDPRLENLILNSDRRTVAVLDWELATIGPPEMDLGWYLGLERVLHDLMGRDPLPGFATAAEVADDLSTALGRPLQDPAWHQIFAVLRSICINVRQADNSARAGVSYPLPPGEENPMVAVVERWASEHPGST